MNTFSLEEIKVKYLALNYVITFSLDRAGSGHCVLWPNVLIALIDGTWCSLHHYWENAGL